jgi:hypothetical protein
MVPPTDALIAARPHGDFVKPINDGICTRRRNRSLGLTIDLEYGGRGLGIKDLLGANDHS